MALQIPRDLTTLGVRQTFTNKEQEARVEVQLMPFNARFAEVTTAFGLQAGHQELTAPSPDDPGTSSMGCGTRTATPVKQGMSSTSSVQRTDQGSDRRADRACRLFGSTPNFPPIFCPTAIRRRASREI